MLWAPDCNHYADSKRASNKYLLIPLINIPLAVTIAEAFMEVTDTTLFDLGWCQS